MYSILFVEDSAADARLFKEYLCGSSTSEHQITNVDSLQKAVYLYEVLSPDIVIVDLSLPDSEGEETIMLATRYFTNKPIIILTGLDDLELAKKSVKEGVQDYLVKGEINETFLRRSIEYAIERYRFFQKSEQQQQSLIQQNELLLQTNERLEQFTHMLSHDIRGPIANILGLVQLSEMQHSHAAPAEVLISQIKTTATSLDRHLNDILSLLQEQNSWVVQSSLQLWDNIFSQTTELLEGKIQTSGAKIVTRFNAPEIIYPPLVLKSILLNLISNAIKYRSRDRPLLITIGTQQVRKGVFTLIVKDNGQGIDLEKHGKNLFVPFKRFHPNTEGKGVGLYLIHKIVEELGGKVTVESQVDVGTTFTFLLPEVLH